VPPIHTLDLHYRGKPGSIAAYVIEAPGGPVMIETGPGSTTGALSSGLASIGLRPADVRHVFVTHIHFDHAGASGWMARHGAHVYVHHFGRPHLVDPAKLNASARRIYKDRMDELWGELLPIPERQVSALRHGDLVSVAGISLRVIETPGHARHHHVFVLDTLDGKVAFTGDAAATYVVEAPEFISLPTPPPEFELGAWLSSIDRLKAERFAAIYPTHFGRVGRVADHLARVRAALREHTAEIRRLMREGLDDATITRVYTDWFVAKAEAAGIPAEKLGFYVRDTIAGMNVMGMLRYWRKAVEATSRP